MARYSNDTVIILDTNGNPIAGAYTYFYQPGTTTLKSIYSDEDLLITQANPVRTLSGGILPEIFIDGLYAVKQNDADNVALYPTQDPVGEIIAGQFEAYNSADTYAINEIVLATNGSYYISLVSSNQGNEPSISSSQWQLIPVKDMASTEGDTFTNPTFVNPALGTPASGVMTNVTGTAAGLTAGLATTVTTNADLTGDIVSTGNATSIATGVIVTTDHVVITAGTTYTHHASQIEEESTSGASYAVCTFADSQFVVLRAGTYRCEWEHKSSAASASVSKVYKDGVAFGVEKSTSSTSYATVTDDLVFAAGDIISLYQNNGVSNNIAKNFKVLAATQLLG